MLNCCPLWKVKKKLATADPELSRKPWNMKATIQYKKDERTSTRGLILTNKQKKKILGCDLSFNSAELQMHPLSHWQADRVRTPTGQQSTVLLSCWWWRGFQGALFHNATLGNIKNSKGNKTEQGQSTRWIQQWGWFLKMSLKTVITDAASQCCQTVPCYATARTTAEAQYTLFRCEQKRVRL